MLHPPIPAPHTPGTPENFENNRRIGVLCISVCVCVQGYFWGEGYKICGNFQKKIKIRGGPFPEASAIFFVTCFIQSNFRVFHGGGGMP